MRITPLDVRKQEFKKVVRGLDPEEVYAFLATVADEYETVLTDNRQLRDRVLELDDKVVEYRNMEKTLRDTLMTAERVMAEARDNARKEAELILRDAKVQAQQDSQNTAAQAEALKAQLRELRSQRDAFLARLKGLAEAQIGMVDSFVKDFQEDDRRTDFEPAPRAPEWGRPTEQSPRAPEWDYATEPSPRAPEWDRATEPSPRAPEWDRATERPSVESFHAEPGYHEDPAPLDPEGPTRGYRPSESSDHWRDYHPASQGPLDGVETESFGDAPPPVFPLPVAPAYPPESPAEASVGELAQTVAEMAHAAGDQSGHLDESVPSSPDSGAETSYVPAPEPPEEEPATVASAEESEESQGGSRWSISRFTRGLGDF